MPLAPCSEPPDLPSAHVPVSCRGPCHPNPEAYHYLRDQESSRKSSAARLYRDCALGGRGLLERKLSTNSRLHVALRSEQS